MSAVGCYDLTMYGAWPHQERETAAERVSRWLPKPGNLEYPGRYGSAVHYHNQHRQSSRPYVQHQQPVDATAAAAVASLLRQASSIVGPTGGGSGAILPYFRPQMISPESEKPIGCGAFGVVW